MGDVGLEQPFSNHRLGFPNRSRGLQGQNYFIIIIKYLVSFSHKCTEGEKFIDVISDATLELIFKKQPTVECRCSVKEEPQLAGKVIQTLLPFPTLADICEKVCVSLVHLTKPLSPEIE